MPLPYLDPPPPWRRERWMVDLWPLLAPLPLPAVRMVGAHNAGSYAIHTSSSFAPTAPGLLSSPTIAGGVARAFSRGITARWSKCQSMTILEQLRAGVRYLDLRIIPQKERTKQKSTALTADYGELMVVHGLYSIPLAEVVRDVLAFYEDPDCADEFVLIDVQHIYNIANADLGITLFAALEALVPRCIPNTVPLSTPCAALWARSATERIVLFVGRAFSTQKFPFAFRRAGHLVSIWHNQSSAHRLLEEFHRDIRSKGDGDVDGEGGGETICIAQAILTPTGSTVQKGIFSPNKKTINSIKKFAVESNDRFVRWFLEWNAAGTMHGERVQCGGNLYRNVLMLDFVEEGHAELRCGEGRSVMADAVEVCVFLNAQISSDIKPTKIEDEDEY